ncbi:MAG: lysophospholipase [Treponema sp.]|nr:lysophospholipase [Treponema sp.]
MKQKHLFLFALLAFNSCLINNPVNSLYNENELPQYRETSMSNPRGIVIVVHGLNVKPSKMGTPSTEGTLVKLLLESGYHVCRVTLKGHGGSIEDMQNVTRSDWIDDAYSQYCLAKTIAERERLPLYFLGFSLGALVYEVLLNEETEMPVQFEKVILFSPAVAIRPSAKTILMLKPFTTDKSIIRSVSPKEYRAQRGASMAAYKIIFNMEESLNAASFKNCNIDTIIFIDVNDEMISAGLLRERIEQYELTNWKIHEVSNTGAVIRPLYHHLLIDNRCVSASTWEYITGTILNFIY